MPSKKKLQIALEFMIIFSFVLVVFTVLFAVIAAQRAQTASSQVYSQEQLIAQNIAAQLDRALQAGGGYFAKVPLSGLVGSLTYQISITKNGAVIVNASVGTEVLRAIAYSTVKDVVSDPTFSKNGALPYYNLPVANGTIVIQNSFGTICVDYQCPSTLGQARNISLSSQSTHAGNFNGRNTYVNVNSPSLSFGGLSAFSIEAWVTPNVVSGDSDIVGRHTGCGDAQGTVRIEGGKVQLILTTSDHSCMTSYSNTAIVPGRWYQVVEVYDGSNLYIYINGAFDSKVPDTGTVTSSYPGTTIGAGAPIGGGWELFNGQIANVQIYSNAITAQQIQQQYLNGISALPIPGNSLLGWWPLNGNANDYSGYGTNGNVIGPLLYTSVSQLTAKVTDQFGRPVKNAIVGFSTNTGNFTSSRSTTNYTNGNGIAIAFLNQKGVNGQAFVTAAAYNGNLSFQGNLIGWWPLSQNLTQGQTIYDLSGNANNGIIINYAPNLAAQFDGVSSYIAASAPQINTGGGYNTVSFWMYWNGWTHGTNQVVFSFAGNYLLRFYAPSYNPSLGHFGCLGFSTLQGDVYGVPVNTQFNNKWVYITAEFYNGAYVNGAIYINKVQQPLSMCSGSPYSASASNNYQVSGAYGSASDIFSGQLSNIQIYNTQLNQQQFEQLYYEGMTGQPLGSNLVAWYPLSGNSLDLSSNHNTGVGYGNLNYVPVPAPQTPNLNNNRLVAKFNGVSSYVNNGNSLALSSNSFSVGFWVQEPAPIAKWVGVVDRGSQEAPQDWYFVTSYLGCSGSEQGILFNAGPGELCADWGNPAWHFIVGTYNSLASVETLYLDGALVDTTSGSRFVPQSNPLTIGAFDTLSSFFPGSVADLQIYNTSLSVNEVQALYFKGMDGLPIHLQNLTGWWPLNGNLNEYSGKSSAGIGNNVVYAQQQSLQIANASLNGYGINFNKTYDYIAANVPLVNTAGGAYNTASFWMYWNGNANSIPFAFTDGYNIKQSLWFASQGCFGFSIGNKDAYGMNPSQLLSRWIFVTAEFYNGYNGNSRLYINGVLQPLSQCAGNPSGGSANSHIYIGGIPLNGGYYFNGTIADFRLYSGALSSQQVLNLYLSQTPPKASASAGMSWIP